MIQRDDRFVWWTLYVTWTFFLASAVLVAVKGPKFGRLMAERRHGRAEAPQAGANGERTEVFDGEMGFDAASTNTDIMWVYPTNNTSHPRGQGCGLVRLTNEANVFHGSTARVEVIHATNIFASTGTFLVVTAPGLVTTGQLHAVSNLVDDLEAATNNLQTQVTGLNTATGGLQTQVSALNTATNGLQGQVTALNTATNGLQGQVTALNGLTNQVLYQDGRYAATAMRLGSTNILTNVVVAGAANDSNAAHVATTKYVEEAIAARASPAADNQDLSNVLFYGVNAASQSATNFALVSAVTSRSVYVEGTNVNASTGTFSVVLVNATNIGATVSVVSNTAAQATNAVTGLSGTQAVHTAQIESNRMYWSSCTIQDPTNGLFYWQPPPVATNMIVKECFAQAHGCTGTVYVLVKAMTAEVNAPLCNIEDDLHADANGVSDEAISGASVVTNGNTWGFVVSNLSAFAWTNQVNVYVRYSL